MFQTLRVDGIIVPYIVTAFQRTSLSVIRYFGRGPISIPDTNLFWIGAAVMHMRSTSKIIVVVEIEVHTSWIVRDELLGASFLRFLSCLIFTLLFFLLSESSAGKLHQRGGRTVNSISPLPLSCRRRASSVSYMLFSWERRKLALSGTSGDHQQHHK